MTRERDVVRRSVSLDFVRLEERGLERTWCDVERDGTCLRQHLEHPLAYAILLPKVAVDAMMERRCLADVQYGSVRPKHAIDARRVRQRKPEVARHGPHAPSTPRRLDRSGEPVVERAPRRHTLHLQRANQLLPD